MPLEEHQKKIIANLQEKIDRSGWAVMGVKNPGESGFAYTVGLTGKGMPELFVALIAEEEFKITVDEMNALAQDAVEGAVELRPGVVWPVPEKEYSLRLEAKHDLRPLVMGRLMYPLGLTALNVFYDHPALAGTGL